jgi:hypothetical protein
VKSVTQISRLNIKGSKQNNSNDDLGGIGLFEMDTDDKPITNEEKRNSYRLPDVMGYIPKVHPSEIRVHGNNLNGRSIIQLVNSLMGYSYHLIQNEYEIDYDKLLDDKQYTGESLIFRYLPNK